ncbi:MAG: 1-acyl-sn-glycerol-3-phosphate acyltransferase [Polyangiaceae bacterium]|nr:1-acyl-sn-glycerol-3-phosphate acyltransferase [Polyangiaceae bacterium]
MALSLGVLSHAVAETLRISLPAMRKSRRGTLTRQECDASLVSWANKILIRARVELHVEGQENLNPLLAPQAADASTDFLSAIIVSNHLSLYDIPVIYSALPLSLRMAAKKSIFKIPIWGSALRAAGFVSIDRKSPEKARANLQLAGATIRDRQISLYIAPEGTRSKTGKIQRFKRGAFELALATGLPVLPIALQGTEGVHKKGALKIHFDQTVSLKILPLISAQGFKDSRAMADHVQNAISLARSSSEEKGLTK